MSEKPKPFIVGIYADYPQSGKSTAKEVFVDAGYKELSFATSVKESLSVVLSDLGIWSGDVHEYLYGDWKNEIIPELDCTGGYLMSRYAMFMREAFSQDIWLNTLKNRIYPGERYVIDDLRFLNEYNYIKENGITIKVVRPNVQQNHGRTSNSEGRLANASFDHVLMNDGTREEFQEKIRQFITGDW